MNLRSEFEAIRASRMNREKTFDFDTYIQQVLWEEFHLQSKQLLEGKTANLYPSHNWKNNVYKVQVSI